MLIKPDRTFNKTLNDFLGNDKPTSAKVIAQKLKLPLNPVNAPPPSLLPETLEKARKVVPGCDIYYLEREWREWIEDREETKNPSAAFIAFCRKKYQREGKP